MINSYTKSYQPSPDSSSDVEVVQWPQTTRQPSHSPFLSDAFCQYFDRFICFLIGAPAPNAPHSHTVGAKELDLQIPPLQDMYRSAEQYWDNLSDAQSIPRKPD